jgi:methionine-rich copper-binding protein CopC
MKHLVAVAVLIFGLMAGTLGNAGVAAAHAARIASDPVEDASLSQSPSRVSATFNEAMQSQFAAMTVVGPDGDLWSTGEPEVNGAIISVGVRPLGPSGTYTVNYRATSADGHVVSGSWSFQLTVAGTGTPGPPVAEASGPPAADASGNSEATGGIPVWPFFVGAVVIIGAGAWWAARRRK